MTKKYIIAGLALVAVLLGSAAYAQVTTLKSTFSVYGRAEVAEVNASTGLIKLTIYNDCSGTSTTVCAAWYSMERTIDFKAHLVINAAGRVVSEINSIRKGEKARVYMKDSQPYALQVMGPVEPVACTQEAKLCPDGSYVGRSGPNCEFARCGETRTGTSTAPKEEGRQICMRIYDNNQLVAKCRYIAPGLQQGRRGDDVLHLQRLLQEKGLLPQDSATGYFGPATLRGVIELQKQKGLPATGFVGNMTLEKLEQESQ